MADPTESEMRELLVATAFRSEAFIVARGEKTPQMLETEQANVSATTAARAVSGVTGPLAKGFISSNPPPANLAVLSKLAGVLKYLIEDDTALASATKVRFKDHFSGVLDPSTGVMLLYPACDPTWDAAVAEDVEYAELRALGMPKGGDPRGADTVARWVRSNTFGGLMPTGEMVDNMICIVKLLQWDKTLAQGKIEWNEMDGCITINRKRIEDNYHSVGIRMAMGERYFVANTGRRGQRSFCPSDQNIVQAIEYIARHNKYHEAKEYLEGLKNSWDGVPRMKMVVESFGGQIKIQPGHTKKEVEWITKCNELFIIQFTRTLIGTVARTMEPGCQMDTMLVLKSKQGTKKSSLFKTLAPAGKFTSGHIEFGSKDSRMIFMQTTWLEIAELSSFQKKETGLIKAEITTRSDDYRSPYGRATMRNPRWCVFVGSTNDDKFLRDPTGSRRFWIIPIDDSVKVDLVFIASVVHQLWAEAAHKYFGQVGCVDCAAAVDGESRCPAHRWWLSIDEDILREKINQEYTEEEPYTEWLKSWISNNVADKNSTKQGLHATYKNTDALKLYELLQAAGVTPERCHERALQNRMVVALKDCGYVKKHTDKGTVWISPGMQARPELTIVPNPDDATDLVDVKPNNEGTKTKVTELEMTKSV